MSPENSTLQKPLTVSQLNTEVRSTLEQEIGQVYVHGEISNFVEPSSGHWYLRSKMPKHRCVAPCLEAAICWYDSHQKMANKCACVPT